MDSLAPQPHALALEPAQNRQARAHRVQGSAAAVTSHACGCPWPRARWKNPTAQQRSLHVPYLTGRWTRGETVQADRWLSLRSHDGEGGTGRHPTEEVTNGRGQGSRPGDRLEPGGHTGRAGAVAQGLRPRGRIQAAVGPSHSQESLLPHPRP